MISHLRIIASRTDGVYSRGNVLGEKMKWNNRMDGARLFYTAMDGMRDIIEGCTVSGGSLYNGRMRWAHSRARDLGSR